MTIEVLQNDIQEKLAVMEKTGLWLVNVDKDKLWDLYLNSFDVEYNPIYIERTSHDCNACRQFIKNMGGVVTIKNNNIVSIWDVIVNDEYQNVVDNLSKYIKSLNISDVYLNDSNKIGIKSNKQLMADGITVKTWKHLYAEVDLKYVESLDKIPTLQSEQRTNATVLKRSLDEITLSSAEIVMDMIEQDSLYRGTEHKQTVNTFIKLKKSYSRLRTDQRKNNFAWLNASKLMGASKIRNTVIGTLMIDISDGVDLETAVGSFERKVAPDNYKRPKAIATKAMIEEAEKKVNELGINDSLYRRYAVLDDITINNVIFADRSTQKIMNVFDELSNEVSGNVGDITRVDEISIDVFMKNVIPKSTKIEMLVENPHVGNLVSLIAPQFPDSPNILKWDNNFSWSYVGEMTDSIKNRVKKAGGGVDGVLRASLSWSNSDDLDISCIEPDRKHIYYSNKRSIKTGGTLDVDMNASSISTNPVENITWADESRLIEGVYEFRVHNYNKRSTVNVGFDVEVEFNGETYLFSHPKDLPNKDRVVVVKIRYSKTEGFSIVDSLGMKPSAQTVWGINTGKYHNVNSIMFSPNHWDENKVGNKHIFFMIDNCINDEPSRGFYNEFLNGEFDKNRKVFEMLGSKLKAPSTNNQISGIGFSTTKRNHAYFRVSGGKVNKTVKVLF